MKTLFLSLIIMVSTLFPQSWNNTVTTTINEPYLQSMELFTNKDGNHIVIQNFSGNSVKYYLLNTSGSITRSSTLQTGTGAEFANIAGSNDKIYISYRLGNNVITKKSTNAGSSWSTLTNIGLNNNDCKGVDIAYDYRGLHLVWAEYLGNNITET